jgi:hypothetical protein
MCSLREHYVSDQAGTFSIAATATRLREDWDFPD